MIGIWHTVRKIGAWRSELNLQMRQMLATLDVIHFAKLHIYCKIFYFGLKDTRRHKVVGCVAGSIVVSMD